MNLNKIKNRNFEPVIVCISFLIIFIILILSLKNGELQEFVMRGNASQEYFFKQLNTFLRFITSLKFGFLFLVVLLAFRFLKMNKARSIILSLLITFFLLNIFLFFYQKSWRKMLNQIPGQSISHSWNVQKHRPERGRVELLNLFKDKKIMTGKDYKVIAALFFNDGYLVRPFLKDKEFVLSNKNLTISKLLLMFPGFKLVEYKHSMVSGSFYIDSNSAEEAMYVVRLEDKIMSSDMNNYFILSKTQYESLGL